ncbi:hypothetical protein CLAIMM_14086 [Cladophialophora immunda]|nr:hypothetical protein CLAIMM_14086 [Cladophialophora immunda]
MLFTAGIRIRLIATIVLITIALFFASFRGLNQKAHDLFELQEAIPTILDYAQAKSTIKSSQNSEFIHEIHNMTLGFQKIYMISLPERTDKQDTFTMQAAFSAISYTLVDGVYGDKVPTKALPYTMSQKANVIGCWRAHINVYQKMVYEGVSTALVFEDDADWDVALKHQLVQFARGSRFLMDTVVRDIPHSPYGDDWDILWIGHCGTWVLPDKNRRFFVIPSDPTVLPPQLHKDNVAKPDMSYWRTSPDGGERTRIVFYSEGAVCTAAYAISQKGARKAIYHLSMVPYNAPVDWGLANLFGVSRPTSDTAKWSDIETPSDSESIVKDGQSYHLVYPVRQNLRRWLNDTTVFESQYPDIAPPMEINDIVDTQAHLGFHHEPEKDELIRCLRDMFYDVSGPINSIIQITSTSRGSLAAIRVLIHFNVAGVVPPSGVISVADIASEIGVDEHAIGRFIRFAINQGIFQECPKGSKQISHTGLSMALLQLSPWIALQLDTLTVLPDFKLTKALESRSLKEGKTAAELAFGQTYWEALEQHPESMGTDAFHLGLACLTKAHSLGDSDPALEIYSWKDIPNGTLLVDLGGGTGKLMTSVAGVHPGLQCIIQDLEMNRISAALEIPHELADRVTFQTHDFFTPQTLQHNGPVIFVLKWILHDWPDHKCEEILKHLVPRLRHPGSRLLVIEFILPDDTTNNSDREFSCGLTLHGEAQMLAMDLTMFEMFGSGERTLMDFERLFARVDKDLHVHKVWGGSESPLKLLDVTLSPTDH